MMGTKLLMPVCAPTVALLMKTKEDLWPTMGAKLLMRICPPTVS